MSMLLEYRETPGSIWPMPREFGVLGWGKEERMNLDRHLRAEVHAVEVRDHRSLRLKNSEPDILVRYLLFFLLDIASILLNRAFPHHDRERDKVLE